MSESVEIVRTAYDALARGDVDGMLDLVDPALEWTFLPPTEPDPQPSTCHGRSELARRVTGADAPALELVELVDCGERVVVVTTAPGLDERRIRKTGDLNFHVVTVRAGRIASLRACRSRDEAVAVASQSA